LQLKHELFGFWRQSLDRKQSIFCVSNVTDKEQLLYMSDLNLINTDEWTDLISQQVMMPDLQEFVLQPYQTLWLTNRFEA